MRDGGRGIVSDGGRGIVSDGGRGIVRDGGRGPGIGRRESWVSKAPSNKFNIVSLKCI